MAAALVSGPEATFLGGCADGRIISYRTTGETEHVPGASHSNFISGLASSPKNENIYSIGYDDRVREVQVKPSPSFTSTAQSTAAQPKSIAVSGDGTVFVAEVNVVEGFRDSQRVLNHTPKFTPSAIAAFESFVAIGGEDQKVRLNRWDGLALAEMAVLEGNKGVVSALAFSPDGKLLAAGDSTGRVALFDVQEKKLITSRWSFHSARINSLAWTPDSLHCASASLDTHVYVWSVAKPMKNIAIKNAAPGGANAVLWLEGEGYPQTLASTGADGCVRLWKVNFHV
ncbi:hypothetical protein H0H81_001907 [Sphagnurus paluster]|uniref:Anaphase-promoting complex subunit 4-like WD40 domain-containing protein n=1 Tax=Sphagnurus paluster TaxID=117069 RepID=A0A9P7K1L8_9AGAR|nr:hypothetical protein H0H81_001907 [Sphagnurus paluster]